MSNIKIAIVEDDSDFAGLIKCYIKKYADEEKLSIDVALFQDGLSFISEYRPIFDIVFMDIEMPHMNGMAVARKLYEIDKNICIIFISHVVRYALK